MDDEKDPHWGGNCPIVGPDVGWIRIYRYEREPGEWIEELTCIHCSAWVDIDEWGNVVDRSESEPLDY